MVFLLPSVATTKSPEIAELLGTFDIPSMRGKVGHMTSVEHSEDFPVRFVTGRRSPTLTFAVTWLSSFLRVLSVRLTAAISATQIWQLQSYALKNLSHSWTHILTHLTHDLERIYS